jgi:hypothetical protein
MQKRLGSFLRALLCFRGKKKFMFAHSRGTMEEHGLNRQNGQAWVLPDFRLKISILRSIRSFVETGHALSNATFVAS